MSDKPRLVAADGVRHRDDGLLLADDALRQDLLQLQELRLLGGEHLGDRDARPVRDDAGDVLLRDLLAQQARLAVQLLQLRALRVQLALDLGDPAVLDLGGLGEVALPLVAGLLHGELLQGRP